MQAWILKHYSLVFWSLIVATDIAAFLFGYVALPHIMYAIACK